MNLESGEGWVQVVPRWRSFQEFQKMQWKRNWASRLGYELSVAAVAIWWEERPITTGEIGMVHGVRILESI